MDWAAWGPTIISVITCIFFTGVLWSTQNNHAKRLDDHDTQLDDHTRDLNNHSIDIGMLKAFREGYAAGKQNYEMKPQHGGN
jgi:archaellum component FlaF (FlaF/FlaG flagellin family)